MTTTRISPYQYLLNMKVKKAVYLFYLFDLKDVFTFEGSYRVIEI